MNPVADTPPLIGSRLRFGMRPGLERIRRLLKELGDPHLTYPVVHVAGTNGKGSTCAMIASILAASGLKVGLYTSPHLVKYGERIVVDGFPLTQEELDAVCAEVEPVVRRLETEFSGDEGWGRFTEFEIGTALAFCSFRRQRIDVAVVEVGLGGRLDATNVVEPVLTVITPVDLDHTQVLGHTLDKVAGEKAGILKAGVPLVLAPQQAPAEEVILRRAQELNVPVWPTSEAVATTLLGCDWEGTWVQYRAGASSWPAPAAEAFRSLLEPLAGGPFRLPLIGPHQGLNGATAITAAAVLAAGGWKVDGSALVRGLKQVRWPGRIEVVQRNPLVLLDGAHNLASTEALVNTLEELPWDPRAVLVFGTLVGKPAVDMLERLGRKVQRVVLTQVDGRMPAQNAFEVEAQLPPSWQGRVWVEPDPQRAFARAEAAAGGDGTVLVSGSLYLVGALRRRWPLPALFRRDEAAAAAGMAGIPGSGAMPLADG